MENTLNKRYGLITAITMVVGIVIGSGVFFKAEKRKSVRTEFFYVIKGFFSAYLVAEMAFILVFHICTSGMDLLHDMKIKKKSAVFPALFL